MKSINNFYTLFWILYFSLALAFYNYVSDYVDEFLTLGLFLFALSRYKYWSSKEIRNEMFIYIGIMLFYLSINLYRPNNIINAIFLDFQQQIRPYLVFYSTLLLAPIFNSSQRRTVIWVVIISYIITLFILFSDGISEVLSRENAPVFGNMAMVVGMLFYIFNKKNKINTWIALFIVTTGLVTGKSKYFGEYVVFIAIFYFLRGKIRRITSLKRITQIAMLVAVVLYFTWTKFNYYYVEGFEQTKTEQMSARPATYKTGIQIIFKDYIPFGSGLATIGTNAASVYYPQLYYDYELYKIWGLYPEKHGHLADAFYPTLAEFGIVGLLLFILFWFRRWREIKQIMDDRYYKVALMSMMCLALESVADTSYLSNRGMGYFMLLGICIGTIKYQPKEITQNESNDGGLREGERGRSGDSHPDPGVAARVERV